MAAVMLAGCFSAVNEPSDAGFGGGSSGTGGSSGAGGGAGGGGALITCQADAECGRGNVCEPCDGVKSCVPGCRSDADCARPMSCVKGVVCKTCPCPDGFCTIDPCLDADGDGFVSGFGSGCSGKRGGDCDDTNSAVNPAAVERCSNGRDDDCDGLVDARDPQCVSCSGTGGCATAWDCALGATFCEKSGTPACCAQCPAPTTSCPQGRSAEPHGIDPWTGCRQNACISSNIACPENYAPVCGSNGQTYGNDCERERAGASLVHLGECVLGENLECGVNGPAACGKDGSLYCRDACPECDAWIMRCTKVGACVHDLDCPAGAPPPPALCQDGGMPRASCQSHSCQWSCQ